MYWRIGQGRLRSSLALLLLVTVLSVQSSTLYAQHAQAQVGYKIERVESPFAEEGKQSSGASFPPSSPPTFSSPVLQPDSEDQSEATLKLPSTAKSTGSSSILRVSGTDVARPDNALILYTPRYAPTTRTNPYGVELLAEQQMISGGLKSKATGASLGAKKASAGPLNLNLPFTVKRVNNIWDCEKSTLALEACGNTPIPANGVVLSASGTERVPLLSLLKPGEQFKITPQWFDQNTVAIASINPTPITNPQGKAYPGTRGGHQLVIYTPEYGLPQTGTNEFGFEVTVQGNLADGGVVIAQDGADSVIPPNGFVISGHGSKRDWLIAHAVPGARIRINEDQKSLSSTIDLSTYAFQLTEQLKKLDCNLGNNKLLCAQTRQLLEAMNKTMAYAPVPFSGMNTIATPEQAALASQAAEQTQRVETALWASYPTFSPSSMRAVWQRPTETSAQQVAQTLDLLKQSGINTVFLETFYHGFTIFPSQTYQAYGLPAQNPRFLQANGPANSFDPLKTWLNEAHKRNMKVHVWFQTFYAGNPKAFPVSNNFNVAKTGPILEKYPGWANIQYSALGQVGPTPSTLETGGYYLDPANPEVRTFLLKLIEEIASRYPIDGFQLDYIRYPASFPPDRYSYLKTTWGYTPVARQQFQALSGFDPIGFDKDNILGEQQTTWQAWQRFKIQQVSSFVQAVHEAIQSINAHKTVAAHQPEPVIRLSAAIFPEEEEALIKKHQDWPAWAENGLLDFIAPMTLTSAVKIVEQNTQRAVRVTHNKVPIMSGLFGPFNGNPPETLLQQIQAAKQAGAQGMVIFDSAHLTGAMLEAMRTSLAGNYPEAFSEQSVLKQPVSADTPKKPKRPIPVRKRGWLW